MKIIFLGTNGWFDSETGNTVSVLIETNKEYIICDAGFGIHKVDRFINKNKPIYLFLSHYHLDHIIGLHVLDKFKFPQGISIFGPPGLKKAMKTFMAKPFTIPIRKLKLAVRLYELKEKPKVALKFDYKKLHHSSLSYGYRFYLENKVISYCTDTGWCNNLPSLAQKSDLLITECSLKPGQINKNWPHLNPELAANAAKVSNVKKLALLHFDASLYPSIRERERSQQVARKIFKSSVCVSDNVKLTL